MMPRAHRTRPIYLDHAATTPVDPAVAQAMASCLAETYGNPSSTHVYGREAAALVERGRAQVAALLGAPAEQIVFTSGATESNNLAVLGVARANADRGRHVVTSRIEHRSVLDACRRLEREGFRVTWLAPDGSGRIDPDAVRAALRPQTILVSILHVSNEIGVIQDIGAIGALCRDAGVAFHSDAAQSAGRLALDVPRLPVDFLSLTAHKLYGPKGIGALYVRRGARGLLSPLLFGGGQEQGLRPGTLATSLIVGFGVAAARSAAELVTISGEKESSVPSFAPNGVEPAQSEWSRIETLRDRLWTRLARVPGTHLNGAGAPRVPHILSVSFEGVDGESLVTGLDTVALSTGAACSSASGDPSHVLRALGRGTRLAESSLRLSLGRCTTAEEVDFAAAQIEREVLRLRRIAPGGSGWPASGASSSAVDAPAATARVPHPQGAELDSEGGDLISSLDDGLGPVVSRLFRELPHAGVITGGRVLRGEAGGPDEEVWVRFHVALDADDIVKDARFEARGCPHTLAAASWIAAQLPGRRRAEGIPGEPQAWARALGAPIEKLGRLLAVEDALIACLGLARAGGIAHADPGARQSEADRR